MAQIFVDRMSQPSRTVAVFCRVNGLDVREEVVNIAKGGTRAPAFLAINPLGKVPYFKDADGFGVAESAAIMRYLCATRAGIPAHWYPVEPRARALVDSVMAWHGSTLRVGSMVVVWNRAISLSMGFKGNEAVVEGYGLPTLQAALKVLDGCWLAGRQFVAGDDITIADLLLACEVEQLRLLDAAAQGPSFAALMEGRDAIQPWLARVSQRCAPHYDDVHALLRTARQRLLDRRAASKL